MKMHRLLLAQGAILPSISLRFPCEAILPTIVRPAPAYPKLFPELDDSALTQAMCLAADKSAESGTPVSIG